MAPKPIIVPTFVLTAACRNKKGLDIRESIVLDTLSLSLSLSRTILFNGLVLSSQMGIHAYLSPVDTQEGDLEYALMPQRQRHAKQTNKQPRRETYLQWNYSLTQIGSRKREHPKDGNKFEWCASTCVARTVGPRSHTKMVH